MSSRSIRIAALALIAVPAVAFTFGGWVVITVDSLPEYAVAGKPTTVTYTVRQHGMTLLGGLRPYVVARNGSGLVEAKAAVGETLHVRGADTGRAVDRNIEPPEIVADEDNEVRLAG